MDPLTVLFAYGATWVDTLNYTLGAAVVAPASVYFTRNFSLVPRGAAPAVGWGPVSGVGGRGCGRLARPAQLGYPLCLFALGSGCALSYLAVTHITNRNLGWVLILVFSHLAAYCVLLSAVFVPFVGASIFGFFVAAVLFSAALFGVATWCVLHWNPAWTPWWISGNAEGRAAFFRKLRRKKE